MKENLQVIDLFSGVGGLSLGAAKSGFKVAGAVEWEKRIVESHARNFPSSTHIHADVSTLVGKELLKKVGIKQSGLTGLIGGPPCQGFSTIGKRNINDSRNRLFLDFFRLVVETMPVFFLAENVPGILNPAYDNVRNEALSIVDQYYNVLEPIKVNASEYGAATTRTRIFFIGVRKDVKGAETLQYNILAAKKPPYNDVEIALKGLPIKISDDWITYDSSWRHINLENTTNYITSINRQINNIGNDNALNLFFKNSVVSGCFGTRHSNNVTLRYLNLEPGKQDPISKSIKLKSNGYCPTLRAGTDSTKGSFQAVRPIHPTEPRVITPREAARLQGFPDWFQFHETKWHSFRQIGNSVCPIAAENVLSIIKNTLSM